MSERLLAPIRTWLAAPMNHDVSEAIERLRRAPDVQQIAVMPDVHLAADVCIGVVVATWPGLGASQTQAGGQWRWKLAPC
jgi:hypothetical protein